VTFMFTDIEGSTRLARMLGDGYGPVLNAHRAVVRAALSDFDGVELFTEGDSFFVAFRDAVAALAACVEAQRRLSAHDWPGRDAMPRVRMGLHTGWAQPRGDEYASLEVHRAARVAAAAHGGQVLCSVGTAALAGLAVWLAPPPPSAAAVAAAAKPVAFGEVKAVIDQRCTLCHNAQLQQKNVALHTPELIQQHAQQVYQQAVVLKLMPLNNATQMTDAERAALGRWVQGGAKAE